MMLTPYSCSCTCHTSLGHGAWFTAFRLNTLGYTRGAAFIQPCNQMAMKLSGVTVWAEEQRWTWYRLGSFLIYASENPFRTGPILPFTFPSPFTYPLNPSCGGCYVLPQGMPPFAQEGEIPP